jgi:hypothetical protein
MHALYPIEYSLANLICRWLKERNYAVPQPGKTMIMKVGCLDPVMNQAYSLSKRYVLKRHKFLRM